MVTVNLRLFISLGSVFFLCLGTPWAKEAQEGKEPTEAEDSKEV